EVKLAKVVQAEAALATTRANLEAAEIALDKARYSLSLTRIVSPFNGVVTARNYQNGRYVRSGEQGGRLPLLTVQRTDGVRVVLQIPERDVPLAEPDVPVDLTLAALPNVRLTGLKITRVAFAVDEKTKAMRAEIDVANPKQLLRPGMSG